MPRLGTRLETEVKRDNFSVGSGNGFWWCKLFENFFRYESVQLVNIVDGSTASLMNVKL